MDAISIAKDFSRIATTAGLSKDVIDLLKEKASLLEEKITALNDEITALETENAQLESQNRDLQNELNRIKAKPDGLLQPEQEVLRCFFHHTNNSSCAEIAFFLQLGETAAMHYMDRLIERGLLVQTHAEGWDPALYGLTAAGRAHAMKLFS